MHAKGSILGPLLFLIYVNDFQNCLQKGKALMFTDDTTIFFQYQCLSELTLTANTQLENVNKWLFANKLSLNINKTNYIIFQTPRCKQSTKQLNIILNNHTSQSVCDTKFLDVLIHEHLSWKPYMKYLLKKISSSIYCIKEIIFVLIVRLCCFYITHWLKVIFYTALIYGVLATKS